MKKISLVIFMVLLLVGCNGVSNEEAEMLVSKFYDNYIDGNYTGNYELFSDYNKNQITLNEYTDYNYNLDLTTKLISFRIVSSEEIKNYTLSELNLDSVVQVIVSVRRENYSDGKMDTYETTKVVYKDGKELKILEPRDLQFLYSSSVSSVGYMYLNGEGGEKDLQKAVLAFKKSLSIDDTLLKSHYGLAITYYEKEQYEKTLDQIDIAIELFADDEYITYKSGFYNLKGLSHGNLNEFNEAINAFETAIELDSDDVYAEDNLNKLLDYLNN